MTKLDQRIKMKQTQCHSQNDFQEHTIFLKSLESIILNPIKYKTTSQTGGNIFFIAMN